MALNKQAKQWLDLVKKKPVAFGIEVGFEDLTDIHNQWIKEFLFEEDDQTLLAHRGSYKTTCLAIAVALMIVVYPTLNIVMVRKADDDVKEIILQIAKLLQTPIFNMLSVALYGKQIKLSKHSAYEIDTNLKQSPRGAPQLLGIGSKASITGKHADIVITDDIVNVDDRISKAHRDRTKIAYQELQNIKNRGGRFINTGTPWHEEDAFTLMPNISKYNCYDTGLMNDEEIADLKQKMTASLFAANYELKHISDEDKMFFDAQIDNGEHTTYIYDGYAHIDASYGGGDGSAFTVLKRHSDGNIYVYGLLKEKHIDDVLPEFEEKRKLYRAGTLYNETNADKGYLAKQISKPVSKYHESMNKFIKISTYLRQNWHKIIFVKDTDPNYINQILEYSENAEHDDAPDSLASLIRETEQTGGFKAFKHSL